MRLSWTSRALQNRRDIYAFIEQDNPTAAAKLDDAISKAAHTLSLRPSIGRPGRVADTREWVLHPNYILIYRVGLDQIDILRILHAAQRWP